jgi:hypothetical protein
LKFAKIFARKKVGQKFARVKHAEKPACDHDPVENGPQIAAKPLIGRFLFHGG